MKAIQMATYNNEPIPAKPLLTIGIIISTRLEYEMNRRMWWLIDQSAIPAIISILILWSGAQWSCRGYHIIHYYETVVMWQRHGWDFQCSSDRGLVWSIPTDSVKSCYRKCIVSVFGVTCPIEIPMVCNIISWGLNYSLTIWIDWLR
jgi:hypothetical protein